VDIKIVVARENDNTFNTFFVPSAKRFSIPTFQIGDKPDPNGNIIKKPIIEKYDMMVRMMNENDQINDNSIIVFIHEDVNVLDNHFIDKINTVFSEKPEIGVLGVKGVKQISKEGWWFDEKNKPVGHIIEGIDGKNITEGKHTVYGTVGYIDDVTAVEGCLLAVRSSIFKSDVAFDTKTYKYDRDMYAMDLCVQALLKGYKVCVADILIYHHSNRVRSMSDDWKNSKTLFNEKYKDLEFPIKPSNICIKSDEIMEVEI